MIRGEDEARQELGPYLERMYRCVDEALCDYLKQDYAGLKNRLTKRSDSSNRNDLIVAKLLGEFDGDAEVAFLKYYRYSMLIGNFSIRVKKFDESFRPNNIYIQLVLDFLTQQHSTLPGMEPPTNIDLGYKFNDEMETEYGVFLRCPEGRKSYRWYMEISGGEAASEPIRMVDSPPPSGLDTERLAKPKREEVEHDEANQDAGTDN